MQLKQIQLNHSQYPLYRPARSRAVTSKGHEQVGNHRDPQLREDFCLMLR
ncbi:MAG: hypothetical protein ACJAS2_001068 [Pseudohongiellaceae bacterium]|jgi:hypothetical protein